MEFVRSFCKVQFLASLLLALLLIVFLLLPLLAFLGEVSLASWENDLTGVFWQQLAKSFEFACWEASLSAVLSCVLAAGVALLAFLLKGPPFINLTWQVLGILAFSLPGVVWSLYYLQYQLSLNFLPDRGLGPVVIVHVLMNLLIVAYSVYEFLQAVWAKKNRIQALASLGASPRDIFVALTRFSVSYAFRNWGLIIFIWSFMSFSVVLILGGQARATTPEVLLFYYLQDADVGSVRVLILWLLQFLFIAGLFKLGRGQERGKVSPDFASLDSRSPNKIYLSVAGVVLGCLLVKVWAIESLSQQLWIVMGHSVVLALLSMGVGYLLFQIVIFCRLNFLKSLKFLWAFSTVSILALWTRGQLPLAFLDFMLSDKEQALLASAVGMNLVLLPLLAQWIEDRFHQSQELYRRTVLSLGGESRHYIGLVFRYQCRDILNRVLLLSAVFAVGDLAFSSTLLWRYETLAIYATRAASRYQFEFLSLTNFFMLSFVLMAVVFFQLKGTGRQGLWR